jgi:hypothetical protein
VPGWNFDGNTNNNKFLSGYSQYFLAKFPECTSN